MTRSLTSGPDPEFLSHVEHPGPRQDAVLAFMFDTIVVRAVRCDPPALVESPHVAYGRDTPTLPTASRSSNKQMTPLAEAIAALGVVPLNANAPVDIVAAIGSLPCDEIHRDLDAKIECGEVLGLRVGGESLAEFWACV